MGEERAAPWYSRGESQPVYEAVPRRCRSLNRACSRKNTALSLRRSSSSNNGSGNGCGLFDRHESPPDTSQLSSSAKTSKMRKAFSFMDGGAAAKVKRSSAMCGEQIVLAGPFRSHRDKKQGIYDKIDDSGATVSETRMTACQDCTSEENISLPLDNGKIDLQTDAEGPHSEVPTSVTVGACSNETNTSFLPGSKESFSSAVKCAPQSTANASQVPVQHNCEQPLYTEITVPAESNKSAATETSVLPAPEFIYGSPQANVEDKSAVVKDLTQGIAANDVHSRAPLTVVEDHQMVSDTSMKVCESSTIAPTSADLAAYEVPSDVDKSKPTATPARSLATGTGARPKTGAPRAGTETQKKKTKQLRDPSGPTPRCIYNINLHRSSSPPGFASVVTDSSRPEDDVLAKLSQREKDLYKDLDFCSSSEEWSASMQEMERYIEEQLGAAEANLSEYCALKVKERETGCSAQLSAEMQSSTNELINLKTCHTGIANNHRGLRRNFDSQEQEYGNIPEDAEEDRGSRQGSTKQKRHAKRVGAEKRHAALPQQSKATKQEAKHYRHIVHEQRMLRQQLKNNSSFERKKEKLLATLLECKEQRLKFEVAALEVELKERELLRRISRLHKVEAILENLRRRVAREDAEIEQMAAELAMLMDDAEFSREHLWGG